MEVVTLSPPDNRRLANLCGVLDENLQQIERACNIEIKRRGDRFHLSGEATGISQAAEVLRALYRQSDNFVSPQDVQLGLMEINHRINGTGKKGEETEGSRLLTRRSDLRGRTPHQIEYLRLIQSHDITLATGPAGTGKTYLAVACAVDAYERHQVERLILTRPAVEAGERLGFLPGDLAQKVDPYLRPLYDALYDLMGMERVQRLFEYHAIEIAPLAYMRGRTLNHAFIILDEAQNTTPQQMKMFLTRIGVGSRAVINGDVTQVDLPKGQLSGLAQANEVLKDVQGLAQVAFTSADVVRHPLVARIISAYEAHEARYNGNP